ncbi:MAG: hypothetical protein K6B70_08265, partial [Clostridia bacterium]|nr:hypothetical protein [Clostridia bacterium]
MDKVDNEKEVKKKTVTTKKKNNVGKNDNKIKAQNVKKEPVKKASTTKTKKTQNASPKKKSAENGYYDGIQDIPKEIEEMSIEELDKKTKEYDEQHKKENKEENKKITEGKVANKKSNKGKTKKENKIEESKETEENLKTETTEEKVEEEQIEQDENIQEKEDSKFDTISLKEIEDALKHKVGNDQRKSIWKEILINFGIAIFMIFHLVMIFMGNKNIELGILQNDIKIISIFILMIGITVLEVSYKRDNLKLALNGVEILVFGAANVCLVYVLKLYLGSLSSFLSYIGIALIGYYFIKIIVLSIYSIKKYKKDNND